MSIIKIVLSSFIIAFVIVSFSSVTYAQTASKEISDACDVAAANGDKMPAFCEGYQKEQTDNPVVGTLNKVANIIAFVSGAVAVIMVMYGAFQFITSDGNNEKVSKGRQTIFYAAVGLVVIISARVLVSFAIEVLIK